ncbi:N-acetyl-gamma-glutamyl-phosphate reductase [Sesbania bispinosa]|nr:N-acetyl-gamma-glutamyl-phosphate reductase [Sesbania bispinosa]
MGGVAVPFALVKEVGSGHHDHHPSRCCDFCYTTSQPQQNGCRLDRLHRATTRGLFPADRVTNVHGRHPSPHHREDAANHSVTVVVLPAGTPPKAAANGRVTAAQPTAAKSSSHLPPLCASSHRLACNHCALLHASTVVSSVVVAPCCSAAVIGRSFLFMAGVVPPHAPHWLFSFPQFQILKLK